MAKRDLGTGTSTASRKGLGTLTRFRHIEGATFVVLERQNGQRAKLTLSPALSQRLLDQYGHREGNFISVSPLMGMLVSYEEDGCGMLVDIKPFKN